MRINGWRLCGGVGVFLLLCMGAGCEQALFPSDVPRTQYERYDRLRGRHVPANPADRMAMDKATLRERLAPARP